MDARPFDTIHDVLWCLSLVQSLFKDRNAPIRRIQNRRVKISTKEKKEVLLGEESSSSSICKGAEASTGGVVSKSWWSLVWFGWGLSGRLCVGVGPAYAAGGGCCTWGAWGGGVSFDLSSISFWLFELKQSIIDDHVGRKWAREQFAFKIWNLLNYYN